MTRERAEDIRIIRAEADEAEQSNPMDMLIPVLRGLADVIERLGKRKRG